MAEPLATDALVHPRGGNNVNARAPLKKRALGKPCDEGAKTWKLLVVYKQKEPEPRFATASISGAFLLGAPAVNAELVPLEGRVDHNLLLHFWQLVVSTYIPMLVNRKKKKVEPVGYVLAIPDVADLVAFRQLLPQILAARQDAASGRIPERARLDLPEQAGLEVYRCLADEARASCGSSPTQPRPPKRPHPTAADLADRPRAIRDLAAAEVSVGMRGSIRAVESYHMLKQGNNVKLLSFSRLAGRPGLVEDYGDVKKDYRNSLFRGTFMRALIRNESWHLGFAELLSQYTWTFFISTEESPKFLPRFGRDAREHLRSLEGSVPNMPIDDMNDEEKIRHLSLLLRRLITRYVDGRAAGKLGLKLDKIPRKDVDGKSRLNPPDPARFQEAQQRVCSDAYLAMRSKHDQDFVEFFAGSVCSISQYLGMDDYKFLTEVLLTTPDRSNPVGPRRLCWEDVKPIAMFAVSAHAFNVRDRTLSL